MRQRSVLVPFLLFLFSVGASEAENIPPEMGEMCEKEGGIRIIRTVHGVTGFFDAGGILTPGTFARPPVSASGKDGCTDVCKAALGTGSYEFVEAESDSRRDNALSPAPGTYRYTVKDTGHPDCAFFDKVKKVRGWGRFKTKHETFYELVNAGHCVAVEEIDAISAKFVIRFELIAMRKLADDHFISRLQQVFFDRRNGEVLATNTRFGNRFRTALSKTF